MKKLTLFIVLILITAPLLIGKSFAVQEPLPYFRVTYEIPKMPEGVYSKESAAKNLALYKQHLQKNQRIMTENQLKIKQQEAFAKQHNEITANLLKDDRREFMRFKPSNCPKRLVVTVFPLLSVGQNSGYNITPKDISRGGIGMYSKVLKVDDEVPVQIKYGSTEIKTTLKIVSSNNGRVGGKFVNIDEETDNKLVYLSSILESDNGMLKTKLSPM